MAYCVRYIDARFHERFEISSYSRSSYPWSIRVYARRQGIVVNLDFERDSLLRRSFLYLTHVDIKVVFYYLDFLLNPQLIL